MGYCQIKLIKYNLRVLGIFGNVYVFSFQHLFTFMFFPNWSIFTFVSPQGDLAPKFNSYYLYEQIYSICKDKFRSLLFLV